MVILVEINLPNPIWQGLFYVNFPEGKHVLNVFTTNI